MNNDFEIGELLDVRFIGPAYMVADMGSLVVVETVDSQARCMIPADWCEVVFVAQADDLGAAMAAAEAAPVDPAPVEG